MGKQKLSPEAAAAKAVRVLAFAKTDARKAKKRHAQKKKRDSPLEADGKDFDHKTQSFTSVANNRGNGGEGTKKEAGANYFTPLLFGRRKKKSNKKN